MWVQGPPPGLISGGLISGISLWAYMRGNRVTILRSKLSPFVDFTFQSLINLHGFDDFKTRGFAVSDKNGEQDSLSIIIKQVMCDNKQLRLHHKHFSHSTSS